MLSFIKCRQNIYVVMRESVFIVIRANIKWEQATFQIFGANFESQFFQTFWEALREITSNLSTASASLFCFNFIFLFTPVSLSRTPVLCKYRSSSFDDFQFPIKPAGHFFWYDVSLTILAQYALVWIHMVNSQSQAYFKIILRCSLREQTS